MSFIKIKNLVKNFSEVRVLDNINNSFELGEEYCIRGASGSGKSTLLYLLGGLDRPSEGNIYIEERDLFSLNDKELALFRNKEIGFIFQFHFLLSSMNCLDNILLPARIGGYDEKKVKANTEVLIEKLKISHCLKKYPFKISGGEQQRVSIVRALSLRPKILLCDEPTGNLDSENSLIVADILKDLSKSFQTTLIIVTHDMDLASKFKHQLKMKDGSFE